MKKTLLLLSLTVALLRADAPDPWAVLAGQSDQMAAAIQARDTHALHLLDAAIGQETAGLRQNGPALPDDKKKALDGLLADMADQAAAAHHDAHAAQWDDAAAARAKLAADLQAARALLPR